MRPNRLSYSEIVHQLESLGIMPDRAPSLEPMQQGLGRLSDAIRINSEKTIVVAGTNGKGSVCSTLEALLLSEGKTVGLYTSPHLEETTERIRINGKEISKEVFCKTFEQVWERTSGIKLTHFEVLTLMAVWAFCSGSEIPPVEWMILEVGLGGTWDATNAVPHHFCVICRLGHDHQNLLGNDLRQIAANKFGIVGENAEVIHASFPEEVLPLAEKVSADSSSRWTECAPYSYRAVANTAEPEFFLKTAWGEALLSLAGARGAQNTALALTVFQKLGFQPGTRLKTLKEVSWPGRMEKFFGSKFPCPIYLSGDHNPQGIQSLLELLPYYRRKHLHILAGVGKDKEMDGILSPLFCLPDTSIYLTESPFKGRHLADYRHWLGKAKASHPDPKVLLDQILLVAQPSDIILVTGSLYLVGALRKYCRIFI